MAGSRTALPVLILTARDGWSEKVEGFKAGADDYLTKPFRVEELIMRLRALVRRSAGHSGTRITCGPITFDTQTGLFEKEGLPLKLTALEWRVLECLVLRKNVAVDRGTLVEKIYDGDVGDRFQLAGGHRGAAAPQDRARAHSDGTGPRLPPRSRLEYERNCFTQPALVARRSGLHRYCRRPRDACDGLRPAPVRAGPRSISDSMPTWSS